MSGHGWAVGAGRGSRLEDKLADEVVHQESRLRDGDVGQRIDHGDDRSHTSGDGDACQFGEVARRVHGGADQGAVVEVEAADVEWHHRAGDCPGCDR